MLRLRRVVEQARQPVFFTEYGVPDTLDGRFELICLHAFLYLHRLKAERRTASRLCQGFFDTMFADFDRSLREMGTGDLSVGKQVKRMAQAFYGRIRAYEEGLAGDEAALPAALARNLSAPFPRLPPLRLLPWRTICAARWRAAPADPPADCSPAASRSRRPQPAARAPRRRRWSPMTACAGIFPPRAADAARLRAVRQRIAATAEERRSSAARFDLLALDRLVAEVEIRRQGGEMILLSAAFEAEFEQGCVVTLEPVRGAVADSFSLLYGPAEARAGRSHCADEEPAFEPLHRRCDRYRRGGGAGVLAALAGFPARARSRDRRDRRDRGAGKEPFAALSRLRKLQNAETRAASRADRRALRGGRSASLLPHSGFWLSTALPRDAALLRSRSQWPSRKRRLAVAPQHAALASCAETARPTPNARIAAS